MAQTRGPNVSRKSLRIEDKLWFGSLLAGGLLGLGVVAMIAYVLAGPDGAKQSVARPSIAGAAGT